MKLHISGHVIVFVSVEKAPQEALKHCLALGKMDMRWFMNIKHKKT